MPKPTDEEIDEQMWEDPLEWDPDEGIGRKLHYCNHGNVHEHCLIACRNCGCPCNRHLNLSNDETSCMRCDCKDMVASGMGIKHMKEAIDDVQKSKQRRRNFRS